MWRIAMARLLDALGHQAVWLVALGFWLWHPEWVDGPMMLIWLLVAIIMELCFNEDA